LSNHFAASLSRADAHTLLQSDDKDPAVVGIADRSTHPLQRAIISVPLFSSASASPISNCPTARTRRTRTPTYMPHRNTNLMPDPPCDTRFP